MFFKYHILRFQTRSHLIYNNSSSCDVVVSLVCFPTSTKPHRPGDLKLCACDIYPTGKVVPVELIPIDRWKPPKLPATDLMLQKFSASPTAGCIKKPRRSWNQLPTLEVARCSSIGPTIALRRLRAPYSTWGAFKKFQNHWISLDEFSSYW